MIFPSAGTGRDLGQAQEPVRYRTTAPVRNHSPLEGVVEKAVPDMGDWLGDVFSRRGGPPCPPVVGIRPGDAGQARRPVPTANNLEGRIGLFQQPPSRGEWLLAICKGERFGSPRKHFFNNPRRVLANKKGGPAGPPLRNLDPLPTPQRLVPHPAPHLAEGAAVDREAVAIEDDLARSGRNFCSRYDDTH